MTSSCHLKTNICTVHINNDNLYGAATRPLKASARICSEGEIFFMGGEKLEIDGAGTNEGADYTNRLKLLKVSLFYCVLCLLRSF